MSPEKGLDSQAGLSQQEKQYLADNKIEDVYAKIGVQKLYAEVMSNIHVENMNKVDDHFLSPVQLSINTIEQSIAKNTDVMDRYQKFNISAIDANKTLKMSDKGIALVQALAEACVASLPDGSSVKKTLKETKYFTSHKEIDGYMGPNTVFLLEKIAKADLGDGNILSFDGTITPALVQKMYQQCNHETEQDHVADVLTPEQKIVAIDKAIATIKKELDAMNPGDEGYENKTKELTTLEDQKKALTPPDEKPINEVSPEQQDANEKKAILSTVRLSDGKEKGDKNINTFEEVHDFIEQVLENYLDNKITVQDKKALEKHYDETLKSFGNSTNPYLATYTWLSDDVNEQLKNNKIEGANAALLQKVVYLLKLMKETKQHNKDITFQSSLGVREQMSDGDREEVSKGLTLDELHGFIGLIKGDVLFKQTPKNAKIEPKSFIDVLNVYDAAVINYRNDKDTKVEEKKQQKVNERREKYMKDKPRLSD